MTTRTYAITLDDGTSHTVQVVHADMLRAELEAPQQNIPTDPRQLPLATTTLWVWAACKRLGLVDSKVKYRDFTHQLVTLEAAAPEAAPEQPVDPTQPGQDTTQP